MINTTLVLNADASPVSVVPLSTVHWQDAVRILVLNRAIALENYDKWVIRSPSIQLRMPSVIMLSQYQQHNGKIEFSRQNVILRDMYTCQYCKEKFAFHDLTFDHVIPRRNGGKTTWNNIVSACYNCNQTKAHHVKMKPNINPRRPNYWELSSNRKFFPITIPDSSWIAYMGWEGEISIDKSAVKNNIEKIDESLPIFGEIRVN